MKWQNALKDYKHYLKIERGLSKNSITNYEYDINKLIDYLETNNITVSPINISNEEIQPFIYDVSKNVNPRSQSRLISGLRSFFKAMPEEINRISCDHMSTILFTPTATGLENLNQAINAGGDVVPHNHGALMSLPSVTDPPKEDQLNNDEVKFEEEK